MITYLDRVLQYCSNNGHPDAKPGVDFRMVEKGGIPEISEWRLPISQPTDDMLPAEADTVHVEKVTPLTILQTDIQLLIDEVDANDFFSPEQEGQIISILKLMERLRVIVEAGG